METTSEFSATTNTLYPHVVDGIHLVYVGCFTEIVHIYLTTRRNRRTRVVFFQIVREVIMAYRNGTLGPSIT
jgi:hypothetical protein